MELEDIKPPPWITIKENVMKSVATFVLLSYPLQNYAHTRNWIDFEVGLNCMANKPVWVCEALNEQIDFAVPYCTHYCPYDPDPNNAAEVKRLKWYIDMYAGLGPATPIYRAPMVKCPKDTCGLAFGMMADVESFRCPSCRTGLRWNKSTKKAELNEGGWIL